MRAPQLYWASDGPEAAPAVVFSNSLGTDLRLWDRLLPLLPQDLRYIRYDMRGHGRSQVMAGPYRMGMLCDDIAGLIERLGLSRIIFVGLSIGGMIGQMLAHRRPDLVGALVISNSAARMGSRAMWQARIEAVRTGGLASIADQIMARWFAPDFVATPEAALWRARLLETSTEGYLGASAALAEADLGRETATLSLPCLAISGSADTACPPAETRATAASIRGAVYQELEGVGHLPCVEAPARYAALLTPFLLEHKNA